MSPNAKLRESGDAKKPRRSESGQSWLLVSAACVLLAAVGCGKDNSTSESWGPAPPGLQGSWFTVHDNVTVELSLTERGYRVPQGYHGDEVPEGLIGVNSDQIQFSGSNLCVGNGTYRWAINGDSLLFTNGLDPCADRKSVLNGVSYRRHL